MIVRPRAERVPSQAGPGLAAAPLDLGLRPGLGRGVPGGGLRMVPASALRGLPT